MREREVKRKGDLSYHMGLWLDRRVREVEGGWVGPAAAVGKGPGQRGRGRVGGQGVHG